MIYPSVLNTEVSSFQGAGIRVYIALHVLYNRGL